MQVIISAGKQRVVLAMLLLNAGQVVSLDDLAEAVWGATLPASARVTLQNYVKRLRHALADADHGRISTEPNGYRINADAGERCRCGAVGRWPTCPRSCFSYSTGRGSPRCILKRSKTGSTLICISAGTVR
jgi:hypothetical protein